MQNFSGLSGLGVTSEMIDWVHDNGIGIDGDHTIEFNQFHFTVVVDENNSQLNSIGVDNGEKEIECLFTCYDDFTVLCNVYAGCLKRDDN